MPGLVLGRRLEALGTAGWQVLCYVLSLYQEPRWPCLSWKCLGRQLGVIPVLVTKEEGGVISPVESLNLLKRVWGWERPVCLSYFPGSWLLLCAVSVSPSPESQSDGAGQQCSCSPLPHPRSRVSHWHESNSRMTSTSCRGEPEAQGHQWDRRLNQDLWLEFVLGPVPAANASPPAGVTCS